MKALARFAVRHRWLVVVAWLLAVVGVQLAAIEVGDDYRNVFATPGTDSQEATDLLTESFPAAAGDIDTLVWRADDPGGALGESAAGAIEPLLAEIAAQPSVVAVASPFADDPAVAGQVSPDGTTAFARVQFDSTAVEVPREEIEAIVDAVETAGEESALQVGVSGQVAAQLSQPEVGVTEFVGVAVAAVVLFVAFGSLTAMSLPLVSAIASLGVSVAGISLLSNAVSVPDASLTIAVLLGLGVGIDYALFVVNRHRRALRAGRAVGDAVVEAMDSSGRAVLFAGGAVVVALLGLSVVGLEFLTGVGIAIAVAVALTVLAAVTLLPALLAILGTRVLSRRHRRALAAGELLDLGDHHERPNRWVRVVRGRPALVATVGIALMLTIAAPVLDLRLGTADQSSDPEGTVTRTGYDLLADGFGEGVNGPLLVAVATPDDASRQAVPALAQELSALDGTVVVSPPQPSPDGSAAILQVIPASSPQDEATVELIETIREDVVPEAEAAAPGLSAHVGGPTATFDDFAELVAEALPVFLALVVTLAFLLLVLAFRSLLVPAIGALMTLLSAAAAFGAMVAVFQWGWGAELLGVGKAGPIEPFLPIMAFAILFGLSMDYQVFLVSRMHEEWVRTRDNRRAVTVGLAETQPVISAAAIIMVSVFGAFVAGDARLIKLIGFGLAVGVALDAFVLRQAVVPALMLRLGRANWWLPGWLDRILPHVSIEGGDVLEAGSGPSGAGTRAGGRDGGGALADDGGDFGGSGDPGRDRSADPAREGASSGSAV